MFLPVEGGAANEGRIEVFHEGVWQSLCDSSWDLRDGDVVCRELGYGYAVRVVGNALFGEGNGPQWKIDLHCSDNATGLKYCENDSQTEKPCTHNEDAGAICSKTSENYVSFCMTNESELSKEVVMNLSKLFNLQ